MEGKALNKLGIGVSTEVSQNWPAEHKSRIQALQHRFIQVAAKFSAAVICRAAPKQKGDLALLVKTHLGAVVAAIGDGANDVGMIQVSNRQTGTKSILSQ